jgi:probable rRNA maturation factor
MTGASRPQRYLSIGNWVSGLEFSEDDLGAMFAALDGTAFRIPDGDLSVAFLGADEMRDLHKKFLGDGSLTDVVTFPGNQAMHSSGEICVSPDYAAASCVAQGTTFSEELSLYLVHGYLHLFGLNDLLENEAKEMKAGEIFCMSLLKKSNLLPKFSHGPFVALKNL